MNALLGLPVTVLCLLFGAPYFLLMAIRAWMGMNPYHVANWTWPVWQNALGVTMLVALYAAYVWLWVDLFRHKGTRRVIDGAVVAVWWAIALWGATVWAGQSC